MATITGLTAERMQEIEAASVVDGEIIADHLILTKHDGTPIDAGVVVGPQGDPGPVGPAGAAPITGDYKMSAQAADHIDSLGGTWYLCDGRASPHADLTALVGANLPDAPGRALVMKGTHADVNAIGKSDPVSTVANRRPKHNTALTDPTHGHTYRYHDGGTTFSGLIQLLLGQPRSQSDVNPYITNNNPVAASATGITAAAAGGGGNSDQPAFVVPGNLFIYLEA